MLVKAFLLIIILIYFVVHSIVQGMPILFVLAHIPFAVSIFAAVFGSDTGNKFIASIISGILAFIISRNPGLSAGITTILIIHGAITVDS